MAGKGRCRKGFLRNFFSTQEGEVTFGPSFLAGMWRYINNLGKATMRDGVLGPKHWAVSLGQVSDDLSEALVLVVMDPSKEPLVYDLPRSSSLLETAQQIPGDEVLKVAFGEAWSDGCFLADEEAASVEHLYVPLAELLGKETKRYYSVHLAPTRIKDQDVVGPSWKMFAGIKIAAVPVIEILDETSRILAGSLPVDESGGGFLFRGVPEDLKRPRRVPIALLAVDAQAVSSADISVDSSPARMPRGASHPVRGVRSVIPGDADDGIEDLRKEQLRQDADRRILEQRVQVLESQPSGGGIRTSDFLLGTGNIASSTGVAVSSSGITLEASETPATIRNEDFSLPLRCVGESWYCEELSQYGSDPEFVCPGPAEPSYIGNDEWWTSSCMLVGDGFVRPHGGGIQLTTTPFALGDNFSFRYRMEKAFTIPLSEFAVLRGDMSTQYGSSDKVLVPQFTLEFYGEEYGGPRAQVYLGVYAYDGHSWESPIGANFYDASIGAWDGTQVDLFWRVDGGSLWFETRQTDGTLIWESSHFDLSTYLNDGYVFDVGGTTTCRTTIDHWRLAGIDWSTVLRTYASSGEIVWNPVAGPSDVRGVTLYGPQITPVDTTVLWQVSLDGGVTWSELFPSIPSHGRIPGGGGTVDPPMIFRALLSSTEPTRSPAIVFATQPVGSPLAGQTGVPGRADNEVSHAEVYAVLALLAEGDYSDVAGLKGLAAALKTNLAF